MGSKIAPEASNVPLTVMPIAVLWNLTTVPASTVSLVPALIVTLQVSSQILSLVHVVLAEICLLYTSQSPGAGVASLTVSRIGCVEVPWAVKAPAT